MGWENHEYPEMLKLFFLEIEDFTRLGQALVEAARHRPAILRCPGPDSSPPARITWYKITRDGRNRIRENGNFCKLNKNEITKYL